jgi:hypothetical protein
VLYVYRARWQVELVFKKTMVRQKANTKRGLEMVC